MVIKEPITKRNSTKESNELNETYDTASETALESTEIKKEYKYKPKDKTVILGQKKYLKTRFKVSALLSVITTT